jgi:hypothetical protein
MDRFWKIVFVIAVLVAAYVAWEKRSFDNERRGRVRQLAGLLKREDFEMNSPPDVGQQNFFKSLALAYVLRQPERARLLGFAQSRDVRWYLDEANAMNGFENAEARMVSEAVLEGLEECEAAGVFDDPGNLEAMGQGRPPTLVKGPFAGEKFRIDYRITPLAAVELHNHPANFIPVPATVWALRPDRLDPSAMSFAHDLRDARLLEPAVIRRIEETWKSAQKNN